MKFVMGFVRGWVVRGCVLLLAASLVGGVAHASGDEGAPTSVPEVDAGTMASALTLLGGSVLMLTDRLRRK